MKDDDLYQDAAPAESDAVQELPEAAMTSLMRLSGRTEYLIGLCQRLTQENQVLREQNAILQAEREGLIQKYEQSRARVEAMIVRMKDLGQDA
ncbi:MAG TPA: TIGR02449 family protein [Candidatus Competibacteraceae bacterium]|nr:TIGR02449 family protein [Candidatus Competibacteraceae bacterium]HQA26454.1 TIGR02449 family protein [Candidatus Competibacteraceae bacterium]HQD55868.1 TIGR02449 family protein [Candidatus Competibacteraceae bacterium]